MTSEPTPPPEQNLHVINAVIPIQRKRQVEVQHSLDFNPAGCQPQANPNIPQHTAVRPVTLTVSKPGAAGINEHHTAHPKQLERVPIWEVPALECPQNPAVTLLVFAGIASQPVFTSYQQLLVGGQVASSGKRKTRIPACPANRSTVKVLQAEGTPEILDAVFIETIGATLLQAIAGVIGLRCQQRVLKTHVQDNPVFSGAQPCA